MMQTVSNRPRPPPENMPTLNEKIADSLDRLHKAVGEKETIFRRSALGRAHVERLLKAGHLEQIAPGWLMVVNHLDRRGDSTPFFANFWKFLSLYCEDRFGEEWIADAQTSLRLQTGDRTAPAQVMVVSPSGNNLSQAFPFHTSLFALRGKVPPSEVRDGMRVMPLGSALVDVPSTFFAQEKPTVLAALAALDTPSAVTVPLVSGGRAVVAGRLAAAFRSIGRRDVADEIVDVMKRAGHRISESDNPLRGLPQGVSFVRRTSPAAARITAMWSAMRQDVLQEFDDEPSTIEDKAVYLTEVDERYISDSYHSLSIEGYHVTPELIEKVRRQEWTPATSEADRQQQDALAAKGYAECFTAVRETVKEILDGAEAARLVRARHVVWFREMFQPCVTAGIFKAEQIAGYRQHFVYLKGSRFVPVAHGSVQDAMDAYFDAMEGETDARVRVVLGHFVFTYIHPLPDGNGRIGRFIMNAILASGGFPWTVIPVDDRERYMRSLDAASLSNDIRPFAALVADLVRREPPPPRRRARSEEPAYRDEVVASPRR